jgi:hypothetical protein
VAVWIGHIWIRIRTSDTYVWQCGLDISGLGLGLVRHVWQCGLGISGLGLGLMRHTCGGVDWTYLY